MARVYFLGVLTKYILCFIHVYCVVFISIEIRLVSCILVRHENTFSISDVYITYSN